ncbi:olfactory receptor 52P1-like [Gastrophryne carolinensis]
MSKYNKTIFLPQSFILIGIPGLEHVQFWIAIPIVIVYTLTLLGNSAMLAIVLSKESFHKPMYLLFSMLAITDIVASAATTPKILCIFWFQDNEIGFSACMVQLFFIHAFSMMASTVLLAMAYDRYIAICHPLRYHSILNNFTIMKVGIVAIIRGSSLMAPAPFLIRRLSYCRSNIIFHTYCEYMAVVKIACSDTTINQGYGITGALLVIAVDIFGISLSYCAILRAAFRLSSKEARHKALSTCGPHICVILLFYSPTLFSFLAHRFGNYIPLHAHIIVANLYILIPPLCNPIIYGARNKEIWRTIRAVFQKLDVLTFDTFTVDQNLKCITRYCEKRASHLIFGLTL